MAFNKRLFLILFISIFFSTIAGILFHESGHWAGARYCGREAKISYSHTRMKPSEDLTDERRWYEEHDGVDIWSSYPPLTVAYKIHEQMFQDVVFTLFGPLFTLLASITAVIFLRRIKASSDRHLNIWQWTCVLIALFCIRGIIGPLKDVVIFAKARITGGKLRAGMFSDELNLASDLHWNIWSLPALSFMISSFIAVYAIRTIAPAQRRTFIAAFLAGELAVIFVWLMFLGPILLP